MNGKRKKPSIRQAQKEERAKRVEKQCRRCKENPCRCDAAEKL